MLNQYHHEDHQAKSIWLGEIEKPIDKAITELEKSIPNHNDDYWNGYRQGLRSLKKAIVRVLMSEDK